MEYSTERVLKNRLKAINNVHNYLNLIAPRLIGHIVIEGYKVTTKNEVFKKDLTKLRQIANANKHWARYETHYYFVYCKYAKRLRITARATYQAGECYTKYYERSIYLEGSAYTPLPIYDIKEYLPKLEELNTLKAEQHLLTTKINRLTQILIGD